MATDVLPGEPPVEESRDWNVILGITPPPYPERPEVDPYGGMRLSSYENIPLEDAMSFMRQAESMRRQQVEARAAAIRYEGQVDYERLIKAGTTPDEALRQAGPKMFFRHPEGLTASISRMAPQRKVEPSVRTILDEGGIPAYDQVTDSLGRVHVVRYPEAPLGKTGIDRLSLSERGRLETINSEISTEKMKLNSLLRKSEGLFGEDTSDQIKEQEDKIANLLLKREKIYDRGETSPVETAPKKPVTPIVTPSAYNLSPDTLEPTPPTFTVKRPKTTILPGETAPAHVPLTMDQQAASLEMTNDPVPSLMGVSDNVLQMSPEDRRMYYLTNPPSRSTDAVRPPAVAPQNMPVRVRRKSDGKIFLYHGNAEDVPKDKYEIL